MENQTEILMDKIEKNQASLEKMLEAKNSAGVEALQKEFSALNTKVEESNAEIKAQKDDKEAVEKKLAELEADMKRSSGHELAEKKEACKKTNEVFKSYIAGGMTRGLIGVEERKYLRTDVNTGGGFLVPDELSNDIIKILADTSPLRRYASSKTIANAASYVQRKRIGTPTAEWLGEGQEVTNNTNSTYGTVTITPGKVAAATQYSYEMIQDTGFDILSEIRSDVSEQFAFAEGEAFCNGTGINRPKGFTTATGIESVNRATAGQVSFEDIIDLQSKLLNQYKPNAKLYMSEEIFGELRKLKNTQGTPIFEVIAKNEGIVYSLLGSEVVILNAMSSSTAPGATPIFYGDMAAAYAVVTKGAIYTREDVSGNGQDILGHYFFNRVGGDVVNDSALKKLSM